MTLEWVGFTMLHLSYRTLYEQKQECKFTARALATIEAVQKARPVIGHTDIAHLKLIWYKRRTKEIKMADDTIPTQFQRDQCAKS
jgi:hypothetical protein